MGGSLASLLAAHFRLEPGKSSISIRMPVGRAPEPERLAELKSYLEYCRYFDAVTGYYGKTIPPPLLQELRQELTDRLVGYWGSEGIGVLLEGHRDGKMKVFLDRNGPSPMNEIARQAAVRYGARLGFDAWDADLSGAVWDGGQRLVGLGRISALKAPYPEIDAAIPHELSHAETMRQESAREPSAVHGFLTSLDSPDRSLPRRSLAGLPPIFPNYYGREEFHRLDEMASMFISVRQLVHQMENDPLDADLARWNAVDGKGLMNSWLLEYLRTAAETSERARLVADLASRVLTAGGPIRYFDEAGARAPSAVLPLRYRGRKFNLHLPLVKSRGRSDPQNRKQLSEQLTALRGSAQNYLEVIRFAQLVYDKIAERPSEEAAAPLIRALRRVLDEVTPSDTTQKYGLEELAARFNRYVVETP